MTEPTCRTPPPLSGRYHPACELLPEMSEEEFLELVDDIRAHDQRRPIVVDEKGDILDGRHRERACRSLGLEPWVELFEGGEVAKINLIVSENIKRRHLTTAQRAAIGADLVERLAEAAKARQLAGKPVDPSEKGKTVEHAAEMIGGVSPASVARAVRRKKIDPEAHEAVKGGQRVRLTPPAPQSGDRDPIDEWRARLKATLEREPHVDLGLICATGEGRMYGLTVELLEQVLAGRRPPRARAGLLGALNEGDRLGWDPARIRRAAQRDADARAFNRLREAWEEATERARRRVLRWIEREGAKAAGGARQDAAGPAPAGGGHRPRARRRP